MTVPSARMAQQRSAGDLAPIATDPRTATARRQQHTRSTAARSTDRHGHPRHGRPPSVSIEQAAGQADPTNMLDPINFTVVSQSASQNFTTGDVTLNGTALAATATVTGGPASYNVAVTGMTDPGHRQIRHDRAGVASDAAGNTNTTSSMHRYKLSRHDRVDGHDQSGSRPGDPTNATPINFTASSTRPPATHATGDVTLTGTLGRRHHGDGDRLRHHLQRRGHRGDRSGHRSPRRRRRGHRHGQQQQHRLHHLYGQHPFVRDTVGPNGTINQQSVRLRRRSTNASFRSDFTVVIDESVEGRSRVPVTFTPLNGTAATRPARTAPRTTSPSPA